MTDPADSCGKKLRMLLLLVMSTLATGCMVIDIIWDKF